MLHKSQLAFAEDSFLTGVAPFHNKSQVFCEVTSCKGSAQRANWGTVTGRWRTCYLQFDQRKNGRM
jgi:hypothetical protein